MLGGCKEKFSDKINLTKQIHKYSYDMKHI